MFYLQFVIMENMVQHSEARVSNFGLIRLLFVAA